MDPLLYLFAKVRITPLFFVLKTKGLLLSPVNLHNQNNNLETVFVSERRKFETSALLNSLEYDFTSNKKKMGTLLSFRLVKLSLQITALKLCL